MREARADESEQITWWDLGVLAGDVWRHRFWLAGISLAVGVAAVAVSYLLPVTFTGTVTMLPAPAATSSGLLGQLATLTGSPMDMQANFEDKYGEIVKADALLDRILDRKWSYEGADSLTAFAVFEREPESQEAVDVARARHRLKNHLRGQVIRFRRNRSSGFMELRTTVARDPQFAADLANFLAGELERFKKDYHRSRATANREFLEERLIEVDHGLEAAQDSLTLFVMHNRQYANSPTLLRRYGDLQREVDAQSAMWVELRRQLELARFEEGKTTVTLEVLDWATPPVIKTGPKRALFGFVGCAIGLILAVVGILVREQIVAGRQPSSA